MPSCNTSCANNGCWGKCSGSCSGSSTLGQGCDGTCSFGCQQGTSTCHCGTDCEGCGGGCTGTSKSSGCSCGSDCSGSCSSSCGLGCGGNCSGKCLGECSQSCSIGCQNGEANSIQIELLKGLNRRILSRDLENINKMIQAQAKRRNKTVANQTFPQKKRNNSANVKSLQEGLKTINHPTSQTIEKNKRIDDQVGKELIQKSLDAFNEKVVGS